ncbi:MAG: hypothetical protein ACPGPS_05550 [Rubripirellula sp.]
MSKTIRSRQTKRIGILKIEALARFAQGCHVTENRQATSLY